MSKQSSDSEKPNEGDKDDKVAKLRAEYDKLRAQMSKETDADERLVLQHMITLFRWDHDPRVIVVKSTGRGQVFREFYHDIRKLKTYKTVVATHPDISETMRRVRRHYKKQKKIEQCALERTRKLCRGIGLKCSFGVYCTKTRAKKQ
jgi:hypothetical protein